jgi:hypothetical protein
MQEKFSVDNCIFKYTIAYQRVTVTSPAVP